MDKTDGEPGTNSSHKLGKRQHFTHAHNSASYLIKPALFQPCSRAANQQRPLSRRPMEEVSIWTAWASIIADTANVEHSVI